MNLGSGAFKHLKQLGVIVEGAHFYLRGKLFWPNNGKEIRNYIALFLTQL